MRSAGDELRSSAEKLGSSREKLGTSGEKLKGSGMGSIHEEKMDRLVEVISDERAIEVTSTEMEIPFERAERNDRELEGTEEGAGVKEDAFTGVNDITDESVSVEEKGYRRRCWRIRQTKE